jgi:ribosomal protein S18 acetylase RimI-like enzyme
METIIRKATIDDHSIIVDFQMAMALETENLKLDRKILSKGVTSVLVEGNGSGYYIAEVNSQIAGMLMITMEWSDWRNGWVWWIQSVYTNPEFRKSGVYRSLYTHIANLAKSSDNIKGIRLYVDKRNTRAQKVYESLGMNGEHYITYEWMK